MDDAKTHVSAQEAAELSLDTSRVPTASTSAAGLVSNESALSSRRANATLTAEALLNKNKKRKQQKGPNPLSVKKPKSSAHRKAAKKDAGKSKAAASQENGDKKQGKERKLRKKVKDRQAAAESSASAPPASAE